MAVRKPRPLARARGRALPATSVHSREEPMRAILSQVRDIRSCWWGCWAATDLTSPSCRPAQLSGCLPGTRQLPPSSPTCLYHHSSDYHHYHYFPIILGFHQMLSDITNLFYSLILHRKIQVKLINDKHKLERHKTKTTKKSERWVEVWRSVQVNDNPTSKSSSLTTSSGSLTLKECMHYINTLNRLMKFIDC